MKISKILIGLSLAVLPAFSSTILPNGSWYSFQWSGGVGTTAFGGVPTYSSSPNGIVVTMATSPWTFTGPALLTVQDLYADGDQFRVFDNGVAILDTSAPSSNNTVYCGNDPIACNGLSPHLSSGSVSLGAGSHSLSITLLALTSGETSGAAAFQLGAAVAPPGVPEPTTLGLIGLGLVGLALRSRGKRA